MSNDVTSGYNLFFKFIDAYIHQGFEGIDTRDPLIQELEQIMEKNKQFFFIGDMIQMKIRFTSKRSLQMMGISPADLDPYHLFETTHPDDLHRHGLGRAKAMKIAQSLFTAEKGEALLSTNIRLRNNQGSYSCILFQCYQFYSIIPYKTVYLLQIHTEIDWSKKIIDSFSYYVGNDLTYFRYPDEKLLNQGNFYSNREFEILNLIASGNSNEQVSQKLFLSNQTIYTHRRNIIKKSGKASISEVIYDLMEMGLL